ncbi:hypothetical protein AM24_151 [Acinetobacter phage AM24]|nr:hypothetical protein AM24_151 [Acinetobacter phage AM24]
MYKAVENVKGLRGKVAIVKYRNVSDAMDHYKKYDVDIPFKHNKGQVSEYRGGHHSTDWTGFSDQRHFEQTMLHGDKIKAIEIEEIQAPEVKVESRKRKRHKGPIGDTLDIHAVYRGELDRAWTYTKRDMHDGGMKNITLLINIGDNCGISSQALGWRGAVALKVCDVMTEAGYNVRIIANQMTENVTRDDDGYGYNCTTVKDFDEYLDVPKLAAIFCRAGFFRSVIFTTIVYEAELLGKRVDYGLGRSIKSQSEEGKKLIEHVHQDEGYMVVFPSVNGKEDALNAMKEILKPYLIEE